MLKAVPEIDLSTICFHAQQKDPTRTHDLNNIAYSLIESEINLPLSVEEISKLNPYAVVFRYDDTDIEILTRDEAQQIIQTVYDWAKKIVAP